MDNDKDAPRTERQRVKIQLQRLNALEIVEGIVCAVVIVVLGIVALVLGALGEDLQALELYLIATELAPIPEETARIEAGLTKHADNVKSFRRAFVPPILVTNQLCSPPALRSGHRNFLSIPLSANKQGRRAGFHLQ